MSNHTCNACSQGCPIGVRPIRCHGEAYCSTECLLAHFAQVRQADADLRARLKVWARRGETQAAAWLANLDAADARRRERANARRAKRAAKRRQTPQTPVTPATRPAIAPAAPQRQPMAA